MTPTVEQTAILNCRDPLVIIQAAAGTGKTTTLALRVAKALADGVAPTRIVVLTKTSAAVQAFRQALVRVGADAALARAVGVETLEQLSERILASYEGLRVPTVRRLDDLADAAWAAMDAVVQHTAPELLAGFNVPSNTGRSRDDRWVEAYFNEARRLKGGLLLQDEEGAFWPDRAVVLDQVDSLTIVNVDPQIALWFRALTLTVRGANLDEPPSFRTVGDASFDLARYALRGDILADSVAVSGGLALVLLDEMHDLNAAAFQVIRLLAQANGVGLEKAICQLVGVGDADQVIYANDAANARFMQGDDWHSALGLRPQFRPLSVSYRFGTPLSAAINTVLPDKCKSTKGTATLVVVQADAGTTYFDAAPDPTLADVLARHDSVKAASKAKDSPHLAILLRHSHQSFAIENALINAGVPYQLQGLVSCFDWPEVMLMRGLLAVGGASISEAAGTESIRRGIVQAFDQFAKPIYPEEALKAAQASNRAAFVKQAADHAAASEQVVREFLQQTLLKSGYCDALVVQLFKAALAVIEANPATVTVADIAKALQIERLVAHAFVALSRRDEVRRNLALLHTVAVQQGSLARFFHQLNLREQQRDAMRVGTEKQAGLRQKSSGLRYRKTTVTVAHVDVVKGLEFSDVYVPFVTNDDFPAAHAPLHEERNRFYVALSRAKERLTVSAQVGRESDWFLALG